MASAGPRVLALIRSYRPGVWQHRSVEVSIRPLTTDDVRAMQTWRYPPPYDRYNLAADPGDVDIMLTAADAGEGWFAADDAETGELVGFFEFAPLGDEVEIGLGLRPDQTGRRLGPAYIESGLAFARDRWAPTRFALDVYPWNERAIRAYEHVGFVRGERYVRRFDDGAEREFLRMTRPA
jgi:[ribosomal protein S18]-alanine N-acetyltransferase